MKNGISTTETEEPARKKARVASRKHSKAQKEKTEQLTQELERLSDLCAQFQIQKDALTKEKKELTEEVLIRRQVIETALLQAYSKPTPQQPKFDEVVDDTPPLEIDGGQYFAYDWGPQ